MTRLGRAAAAAIITLAATAAVAASPVGPFAPDYAFSGARLTGWTAMGPGDWRAEGGEIIASGPGVLLFDKGPQDIELYSEIKCAAPCSAGLLTRTSTTASGGLRGYLVPFGSAVQEMAEITLDRDGKELSRRKLGAGAQAARFAAPGGGVGAPANMSIPGIHAPVIDGQPTPRLQAPIIAVGGTAETATPPPPAPAGPGGPRGGGRPAGVNFNAGQWNEVHASVDTNVVEMTVNGRPGGSGVMFDEAQSYGPIALYVGAGSGEVRFRTVAYKDIGAQVVAAERVSPNFRKLQLDGFAYAWDTAMADINRDGVNDIVAGPYYYLGPDFTRRREIYIASTTNPGHQYMDNMVTFAHDFTGDGWPDVLATELRQLVLYVNPRGEARRWQRHVVAPGVTSELALMRDLDKDGVPELIFGQGGRLTIAKMKANDPTSVWPVFFVSDAGMAGNHGYGVGDINGDGRLDLIGNRGWWEQPAGGLTSAAWTFHDTPFNDPGSGEAVSGGGGVMSVVDVNGDGRADVITSLAAHGFGLSWFEQKRSVNGAITFVPHTIMGDYSRDNPGNLTFSQLHAGAVAGDFNKDGVIDFVTGKRKWAHLDADGDPDPNSPAVVVLYKGVRDAKAPGGVRFTPEVIDNRSGIGSAVTVADIDKDGWLDVASSGVHGTFVFLNRGAPAKR
jgi:hypothetical protein